MEGVKVFQGFGLPKSFEVASTVFIKVEGLGFRV